MSGEQAALLFSAAAAGAALGALGVYALLLTARKNLDAEARQQIDDGLRGAVEQLMRLSESRLETERAKASAELDSRRQAVEASVGRLAESLARYETMVQGFERDRAEKYGSLDRRLTDAARATEQLSGTTARLHALLGNSRARGQWGERMAEDILRAAGLVENVQFVRDRATESSANRPDFAFALPGGHKLHMDVKFPLDNYLRMAEASADEERERRKAEFLRDVRERIKELAKRGYASPEDGALDYVILFIPNEQVYGFVLDSQPGIIDEALKQKVVLASPFTLYALLAVVRQSFENFHFSRATRELAKAVAALRQDFGNFQERFAKLGQQLQKAAVAYDEIASQSYKRLDQAFARVERLREEGDGVRPADPAALDKEV